MRPLRKLIALVLSLALISVSIPLSALAKDYGVSVTPFENVSEISGLKDRIDSEENILKFMSYSSSYGAAGTFNYTDSSGSNIGTSADNLAKLVNGKIEDTHTDISGFNHLDENGNPVDNDIFFTFNLSGKSKLSGFAFVGRAANSLYKQSYTEEYSIYASDDLNTLYTSEDSLMYHYVNRAEKPSQYYTFGDGVSAKYFGIRVKKAVDPEYGNYTVSYLRLREIALFGDHDLSEENKNPASGVNASKCISELDTDYNLMQDGYVFSVTPGKPGTMSLGGMGEGVVSEYGYLDHQYNENDTFDANINTHADFLASTVNNKRIVMATADGKYPENNYLDIIISLKQPSTIDKFFIAYAKTNKYWQAAEYSLYMSDTRETLFTSLPVRTVTSEQDADELYNTIVFSDDEKKPINYFAIRITKGIKHPEEVAAKYGANLAYPRIAEIALFGKYDTDYYDCSLSSNCAGILDAKTESVFKDKEKTFTAPLSKSGYTFAGFTVNGNKAEYTKNGKENIVSTTLKIMENTNVVANYIPNPYSLEGDTAFVDEEAKRVRIEPYSYVDGLKDSFNVAYGNLTVKRGNAELLGGDFVKTNDKISVDTGYEYSTVTAGDCNGDGTLSVSDLILGIDALMGNGSSDTNFAFDTNSDGTLSVSDLVKARNDILSAPEAKNYNNTTVLAEELKYKPMGRTMLSKLSGRDKTSLNIEWTGSGFSFDAECYGDVTLNIFAVGNTYYTAVVDGKESTVAACPYTGKLVIAKGLAAGRHTFSLYKHNPCSTYIGIYSVTLNGKILDAPKNKDLLIEFIGDSITCGIDNNVGGSYSTNGYMSYSRLTASALDADWSNISRGGATLCEAKISVGSACMPNYFERTLYSFAGSWDFSKNRKADIVVVNLGTNDVGVLKSEYEQLVSKNYTDDQLKAYISARVKEESVKVVKNILIKNGSDTKIVFAFGMMSPSTHYLHDVYKEVTEEYAANGYSAYYCKLPENHDGADGYHPSIDGDIAAANVLSEFIKNNVLN